MPGNHRKNVLPNTYRPVLPGGYFSGLLMKLPRDSLIEICNKWPRIVSTQPHIRKGINQRESNKAVFADCKTYKEQKWNKKHIVDSMLTHWPHGLNLLQLSQIDCQLIVDKPNSFNWILSVVKDSSGNERVILFDPKSLLELLSSDLSTFFMNHIYVCKHSRLPLIIIRIQLFELEAASSSKTSNRPHITSNRAYFIAIPLGSAYIIHSPGSALVTDIILQVLERNIPQDSKDLLTLETDKKQKPVKSLEAMHVFYGPSRFGQSLGAWTPYADATIDISPLAPLEDHQVYKDRTEAVNKENKDPLDQLKEVANLKFKGSKDGKVESDKLYEEPLLLQRKKRRVSEKACKNLEEEKEHFSSIAPIQSTEFLIKEKLNDDEQDDNIYSSITLKLSGTDVFAGLHELSVRTTKEEEMIINPLKMPSWLTEEVGRGGGTVKDGVYYP